MPAYWAFLVVLLATGVFALDLLVPLGIAIPTLYLAVVLGAMRLSSRRITIATAVLCSLLTIVGYFYSTPVNDVAPGMILANRAISLGAIWLTVILLLREQSLLRLRQLLEQQHQGVIAQQMRKGEQERKAAGDLQRLLLPAEPPRIPGFDIAGSYWPFDEVGGDYFDYFVQDGRLDLVIADASGHSLAAAMVMVGLRRLLRSCIEIHTDLAEIMTIANRAVYEDTDPAQYVTACLGRLDFGTKVFSHVSAGHSSYLIRHSGETILLEGTNSPLGVVPDEKNGTRKRHAT
ncbi:MAG: PP2C family protein-serine/threonine phosphatase [Pirellulales bacterium]